MANVVATEFIVFFSFLLLLFFLSTLLLFSQKGLS
jgi:hypothetical protein